MRQRLRQEGGVTTVEWLGMALLAVLVVAMLVPAVRGSMGGIWDGIVGRFSNVN